MDRAQSYTTEVRGCGKQFFYRRFIKDFSKISRPLTNLLKKDIPFVFDDDCVEAFEILKKALISAPIVQPPDWNLPFEIMCDASYYAVGGVRESCRVCVRIYRPRSGALSARFPRAFGALRQWQLSPAKRHCPRL